MEIVYAVQDDKKIVIPDLIRYPLRVLHHRHSVLDTESPTLGCGSSPSPDWGRLGGGVSRKGLTPLVPSQFVQLCDSESSSE